MSKVKEVIIWQNGNVMAFDKNGRQVGECQGCFLDVKTIKNLNKYCNQDTKFYFGEWNNKVRTPINVKWWFE